MIFNTNQYSITYALTDHIAIIAVNTWQKTTALAILTYNLLKSTLTLRMREIVRDYDASGSNIWIPNEPYLCCVVCKSK